jgi:hypothetical protein
VIGKRFRPGLEDPERHNCEGRKGNNQAEGKESYTYIGRVCSGIHYFLLGEGG